MIIGKDIDIGSGRHIALCQCLLFWPVPAEYLPELLHTRLSTSIKT